MNLAAAQPLAPRLQGLYRLAAVAAVLTVALTALAIAAHLAWPPPSWSAGSAVHWFERFQASPMLGLLGLDLLIVFSLVLGIPLFLALYLALREEGGAAVLVATAMALAGTLLHLVSNTAFEMLALSQGWSAATSEAQRAVFLAAGEATLAAYQGTAFHVSYVLGYAAKVALGVVMLRSPAFGRAAGRVGILAGVAGFGLYLPRIGILLSIVSVLFIAAWNALLARSLWRLARAP